MISCSGEIKTLFILTLLISSVLMLVGRTSMLIIVFSGWFTVLSGPGIEAEHCIMESIEGTVILHPIAALCQVNGLPVGKSQRISQGRCFIKACKERAIYFFPIKTKSENSSGLSKLSRQYGAMNKHQTSRMFCFVCHVWFVRYHFLAIFNFILFYIFYQVICKNCYVLFSRRCNFTWKD